MIREKISKMQLPNSSIINKKWNFFNNKITKIKRKYCPRKKINITNSTIFNTTCSEIHKELKQIAQQIKNIKKEKNISLNNNLKTKLTQLSLDISSTPKIMSSLKTLQQLTHKQLSIELNIYKKEKIKEAIENRITLLSTKPKFLINNILEHKNPKASFTKIIDPNKSELIFNPSEIKDKITKHYEEVFHIRSINHQLLQKWNTHYMPITTIDEKWYSSLLNPITESEISITISQLPNNKAPGPSGITYKFIKETSKEITPHLKNIFNNILENKTFPTKWKQHNIYPISKKPIWSYNIKKTRPIALIDSFRKIFTKIITNRLNNILSKHPYFLTITLQDSQTKALLNLYKY